MVVRFGPRAGMCGAVLKEGKMANTNSKPGASDADGHEPDRRDFIVVATYAMGAVGAAAVVWPLVDQMNPAADTLALASTEVDVSKIAEGQAITVTWRGKPVFIRHRTGDEIARAQPIDNALDRRHIHRCQPAKLVLRRLAKLAKLGKRGELGRRHLRNQGRKNRDMPLHGPPHDKADLAFEYIAIG